MNSTDGNIRDQRYVQLHSVHRSISALALGGVILFIVCYYIDIASNFSVRVMKRSQTV